MFYTPLAFAQKSIEIFKPGDTTTINFTTLVNKLGDVANAIIPFLIGVAVLLVIWGIFKYVRTAGDTEKIAEGRTVLIWGIIAIFFMLAFWGFVMVIKTSLGFE